MSAIISVEKPDPIFWKHSTAQHIKHELLYKTGAQSVEQQSLTRKMTAASADKSA